MLGNANKSNCVGEVFRIQHSNDLNGKEIRRGDYVAFKYWHNYRNSGNHYWLSHHWAKYPIYGNFYEYLGVKTCPGNTFTSSDVARCMDEVFKVSNRNNCNGEGCIVRNGDHESLRLCDVGNAMACVSLQCFIIKDNTE